MEKQSDDLVIHNVELPKKTVEYIKCPHCGRSVKSQGIGGHLKLAHGITGVNIQKLNDETQRFDEEKTEEIKEKAEEIEEFKPSIANPPSMEAEKIADKKVRSILQILDDLMPPWWKCEDEEEEEDKG